MIFPLRAIHISFWLFAAWVLVRVWEMNFEVSPLPAITLPIFVFCVLFGIAFGLGRRLQKRHALDRRHAVWSVALLVGGAAVWEIGLTVYLSGWAAWASLFTVRFLIGAVVQTLGIGYAAYRLRKRAERQIPEGLAPTS